MGQPRPAAAMAVPVRILAWRRPLWRGALALAGGGVLLASWLGLRRLDLGGLDFSFLGREAGFGIGFRIIAYTEADSYGRAFLVGLANTLLVAVVAAALATLIGLVAGLARMAPNRALAALAAVYVEAARNVPLLLHILFWQAVTLHLLPSVRDSLSVLDVAFLNLRGLYLPQPEPGPGAWPVAWALAAWVVVGAMLWRRGGRRPLLPVLGMLLLGLGVLAALLVAGPPLRFAAPVRTRFNLSGGILLPPEFVALVVALALYNGAFVAELVRGSFQAIPAGQWQAAAAMALTRRQALRLVILPQALRSLLPPLTNQYCHLIKASSLGAVIGYPELFNVFAGTTLTQTGRAMEVMIITLGVYLAISLLMAAAMRWVARRPGWQEGAA